MIPLVKPSILIIVFIHGLHNSFCVDFGSYKTNPQKELLWSLRVGPCIKDQGQTKSH